MASMALDPSSALAEKYKGNRQILEQAVLGRGGQAGIDPYSALRALQKLNVADKYEQMQRAMQGQPNMPSVAQQTLMQAQGRGMPQVPAPQAPIPAPQGPQGGGLAAMPVPEDSFNMAGGGLVAFAEGDEVPDTDTADGQSTADLDTTELTPEGIKQLADIREQLRLADLSIKESGMTPEEQQAAIDTRVAGLKKMLGGEDYYGDIRKKLAGTESERAMDLEQQKGLAALQAAAALSQGSNLIRGLGAAGAAFGQTYGGALAAAKKEKRELLNAQIALDAAQRKENLGLYNAAISGLTSADKTRLERYKAATDRAKAEAAVVRAGRAPAAPSRKVEADIFDSYVEHFKEKGFSNTEARRLAGELFQQYKQALGPTVSLEKNIGDRVDKEWMRMRPSEQQKLINKFGSEEAWKTARESEIKSRVSTSDLSPDVGEDIDPMPRNTVANPGIR